MIVFLVYHAIDKMIYGSRGVQQSLAVAGNLYFVNTGIPKKVFSYLSGIGVGLGKKNKKKPT